MGKRIVFGGLLAFLAACGGSVEDPAPVTTPLPTFNPPPGEQGIYQPPTTKGPDHVADGLGSPSALAMTKDHVLFTTRSATAGGEHIAAGALYVADKQAGPTYMIALDRRGASFDALTVDDANAFVATSDARIVSVPVMGGALKTVVQLEAPVVALAVSGEYLYFATNAGAVGRLAKKDGNVASLATIPGTISGLQADDAGVYVATGASEEIAAGIQRVAFDGTVTALAAGAEPCAMIRDGKNLYWTSLVTSADPKVAAKGEVRRISLQGGAPATVASGSFSACAIAADATSLYFATSFPDAQPVKAGGAGAAPAAGLGLMRAPIAGGEPVAVAQATRALTQPGAVAVDDTHVYWLTETAVLRLPKQ